MNSLLFYCSRIFALQTQNTLTFLQRVLQCQKAKEKCTFSK
uniref:Uncharacterized protein n=1 Tax=Anguilla anguilla TaxID=7936 RepID=A0A0E9SWD0_ANGAN